MKEPSASEIARAQDVLEAMLGTHADTLTESPRTTLEMPAQRAEERDREALELFTQLRRSSSFEGRLSFEGTLGAGGRGVVRAAEQRSLGRTVAVKTLREDAHGERDTLELLREAWAAGALEHPNVVPIYDLGLDEAGAPLIVMKRVDGLDWGSLMHDAEEVRLRFGADDQLEWNLRILMQVCHAVAYAHDHGIVHRDLKPENVMVGRFGEVVLVDWGLAVSLRERDAGRLRLARDITQMAGTPCYMAPEMLGPEIGAGSIDERTDVYLLGGILHELLTGSPPHVGANLHDFVRSILSPSVPPIAGPQELAALAQRALHYEPGERPQSATLLRGHLQNFLQRRASLALTEAADSRLEELFGALEGASDASEPRSQVHALFAQCRFGYHAALASAPGHQRARAGLRRAVDGMVRYELRRGEAAAAEALLAELEEPNPELEAEVRRVATEENSEKLRLRRLGSILDSRTGAWARMLIIAIMAGPFVLLPLRRHLALGAGLEDPWAFVTRQWALLALAGFISFAARRALSSTLFNQRLVGGFVASLGLQAIAGTAAAYAELGRVPMELIVMFGWAVMATLLTITVERRLWPVALTYVGCFVVATIAPEHRYLAMMVGNLSLCLVAMFVWGLSSRPPIRSR